MGLGEEGGAGDRRSDKGGDRPEDVTSLSERVNADGGGPAPGPLHG